MGGLGAETPAPAEVDPETAPRPEDQLPFAAIELPSTFSDGRKTYYTVDKKTGKIDWMAAAFANPIIAEKLADGANNLMGSISDAVKRVGAAGPHVVSRIPAGARDANVAPSPPVAAVNLKKTGWG